MLKETGVVTNMNRVNLSLEYMKIIKCWLSFDFQSNVPTFCQLRELTEPFMLALKDWFCKKTNIKRKSVVGCRL